MVNSSYINSINAFSWNSFQNARMAGAIQNLSSNVGNTQSSVGGTRSASNIQGSSTSEQTMVSGFAGLQPSINAPVSNPASAYGGTVGQQAQSFVNTSGINYLNNIQTGARELASSLSGITSRDNFAQAGAISSNTDAVVINQSPNATYNFEAMEVTVGQLAQAQQNASQALVADAQAAADLGVLVGQQHFEIITNGDATQFNIVVAPDVTNEQILRQMAEAINDANIGVVANVTENGDGTVALSIQVETPGADNAFQIADIGDSTLIAATGAAQVTQEAQNAMFTVNGEARESATNNVNLGNGVNATLTGTTGAGQVTVSAESVNVAGEIGAEMVRDIVSSFNALLETARTGTNNNQRLQNDLMSVANTYSAMLGRIGVSVDERGFMAIDENRLAAAAESGALRMAFEPYENRNFGFANRLSNIASNVQNSPAQYVTRANNTRPQIDFRNPSESDLEWLSTQRNFNVSRFNAMMDMSMMIGQLFNIYV